MADHFFHIALNKRRVRMLNLETFLQGLSGWGNFLEIIFHEIILCFFCGVGHSDQFEQLHKSDSLYTPHLE